MEPDDLQSVIKTSVLSEPVWAVFFYYIYAIQVIICAI